MSRLPRRRILLAVAAIAAAIAVFLVGRARTSRAPLDAYPLCVAHLPKSAWNGGPIASDAIVDALSRALAEDELGAFRGALDASADLWEVRANPMVDALDDTRPDEPLETWMKNAPREVGIARAALARRYCGTDGFCVEPADDRGACAQGFSLATSVADVRRASFLALPYGAARAVRGGSPAQVRALQERSRGLPHGVLVVRPQTGAALSAQAAELRASIVRYETTKAIALSDPSLRPPKALVPVERKLRVPEGSVLLLPAGTTHGDPLGWAREYEVLSQVKGP